MHVIERLLSWLGHISLISAAIALYFRDSISNEFLGYQVFASGVLSYTLALALSIYLDKTDSTRKVNNTETQTIGALLKPALLMCLVSVLFISASVLLIAKLVENTGG